MEPPLQRRPLFWEGSAKADMKDFPIPVQKDLGVALFAVQLGGMPPAAKPWKGLGPGVHELGQDHSGAAFRVVFTTRVLGRIHVLHAFQKKSKSGIKTPKREVRTVEKRFRALLQRFRHPAE